MKNTMKNNNRGYVTFSVTGRSDYDYSEDAPIGTCELMENLRNEGSATVPVGNPVQVSALSQGERLLTAHRTSAGVNIITCIGSSLLWHSVVADSGAVTVCGILIGYADGEVNCATALGDFVVVGCSGGDLLLHFSNGAYHLLQITDAYPDLRLLTVATSTLGATVEKVKFSMGYSRWPAALAADDVSAVSSAMNRAVARIEESARLAQSHVFPFVVRYAVRMADGRYLHVSAPVVIGRGIPFTEEYRPAATDDGTFYTGIDTFGITADSFRLKVEAKRCFSEEWDGIVAGIDLLFSDEVVPLERGRNVAYRCEISSADQHALLMTRFHNLEADELVRQLLATARWKVRYTITDFNALRNGIAVLRSTEGEVTAAAVEECDAAMALTQCSTAVMQHNRRIFSTGSVARRRSPWGASAVLAVDTSASTSYQAAMAVRIGSGQGESVTVWRGGGSGRPTGVNALLAYPDPCATEIEIQVLEGGVMKRCTAPLVRLGSVAYSVTPGLAGRELTATTETAFTLPEPKNIEIDCCGRVRESHEMNPLVCRAEHRVCDSTIVALAPDMHRSNNAIGTPVYAFSSGGIYALPYRVVSGSYSPGVIISLKRIAQGTQPVNTATWLGFVSDGGDLCRINQYKVERVARHLAGVKAVGSVDSRDEVWLLNDDGSIAVVDRHNRVFTITGSYAGLFAPESGGVMLVGGQGEVYDATRQQQRYGAVRMLTVPFTPVKGAGFKPTSVTLDIAADLIQGFITIFGERGHSCHGMRLCRMWVDGEVACHVRITFRSPLLRRMRIGFEGKMSADAVLSRIRVDYISEKNS